MKLRALKHILIWSLGGALFGAFFGAVSSFFQGGPTPMIGIQQSWWWFAIAGALKAVTDLRLRSWQKTNAEK